MLQFLAATVVRSRLATAAMPGRSEREARRAHQPVPAPWAAPLGLVNDLFTGQPIGFSVALWSATMLALDLIDRRTMWRDYWIEWVLAAAFLFMHDWLEWQLAALMGARVPFVAIAPSIVIAILIFPVVAWLVSRIDRWRLGR